MELTYYSAYSYHEGPLPDADIKYNASRWGWQFCLEAFIVTFVENLCLCALCPAFVTCDQREER